MFFAINVPLSLDYSRQLFGDPFLAIGSLSVEWVRFPDRKGTMNQRFLNRGCSGGAIPTLWQWALGLATVLVSSSLCAAENDSLPSEGIEPRGANVHALTGLRIVQSPGQRIENGTIVIRDGMISSVASVPVLPEGCRVWDLSGKTVYAGFIDAWTAAQSPTADGGGSLYWNRNVRPSRLVELGLASDGELDETLRKMGVLVRLAVPTEGIVQGQSALVTTGNGRLSDRLIMERTAMHLRLTVPRNRDRDYYPNSPMGAVALARQAMYDADWYLKAWLAYKNQPGIPKPEVNASLAALGEARKNGQLFVAEAANEQLFLRADRFAREFSLPLVVKGSGKEYRRLEAIHATGRAVILPLNFPKPPDVSSSASAMEVSLTDLMHWELAPENPGRLDAKGIPLMLTSHGLNDRSEFLKRIRTAVQRGLGIESALAALTIQPAELLGIGDKFGTIEVGKVANLVIADGDLFSSDSQVSEVWISGERYPTHEAGSEKVHGLWALNFGSARAVTHPIRLRFAGKEKLKGTLEIDAPNDSTGTDEENSLPKKLELKKLRFELGRFRAQVKGSLWRSDDKDELLRLSGTLYASGEPRIRGELLRGDGQSFPFTARVLDLEQEADPKADGGAKQDGSQDLELLEVNYPLGAFGIATRPEMPESLLIENATIWTSGPLGVIEGGSLLVQNGVITDIGENISVPRGAQRINAVGRHVTPGIIDCHSHMATDGGVNESAQAITAEVRIGDFVDANDINIYRQLAGGVTTANILHGSANPIGGQNQVIKLRWGGLPKELCFTEAPPGIKFALGENVKQSNRGNDYTTRYPQTRMGVEQLIRDALHGARIYGERWKSWRLNHEGAPPRRDLEKEAIWEIVQGQRWIHCHSYRQDEILALIRTLDAFGIQIGTFQHILEGYKVAPEMKRHGAMASGFSDWWAYKVEVFDAIPYNGSLMHEAGIVVSFNSDDSELARHLNQEAAKAVKYGGVSATEALKFVTLNPAKQLRIDSLVGSLEPGKQADFVIWSGPPLSNLSRCEQTWIDGRCYFSLEKDRSLRHEASVLRARLIEKILESGLEMTKVGGAKTDDTALWPRYDEFCHPHLDGNHEESVGHDGH